MLEWQEIRQRETDLATEKHKLLMEHIGAWPATSGILLPYDPCVETAQAAHHGRIALSIDSAYFSGLLDGMRAVRSATLIRRDALEGIDMLIRRMSEEEGGR